MTDPNVPSETPVPPAATPPAAATPPVAPLAAATPPASPYTAPAAAGPKQGLSLTSFILGLGGLVFSWVLGFGFLVALAAVIIGFIAKGKEPGAPKWMWLVGIIAGFVALFIGLLIIVFAIIALATISSIGTLNY